MSLTTLSFTAKAAKNMSFDVGLLVFVLRVLLLSCLLLAMPFASLAGVASPVAVEIRGEKGEYQLFRGGEPYVVKGVGLGVDAQAPEELIRRLAAHGGNSFRTWHVIDRAFLDLAHAHGITVAICLDMARERHGFDYDDEHAVGQQLEIFRRQVNAIKDHPALLFWIVGNELNLGYTNPRVYDAVNDVAIMIHEVDPLHPVTTATAGISVELAQVIMRRAPELDFISVQVYGGLFDMTPVLTEIDFDIPVAVTEWGTIGHWEVSETEWGAPIELNSREKAETYMRGYAEVLQPLSGTLIANYAFLWGQKQERTPTWYGMFTEKLERTPAIDAMHQIWNEAPFKYKAPAINELLLNDLRASDSIRLRPNSTNVAKVSIAGKADEGLSFAWSVRYESNATESGGDVENVPSTLPNLVEPSGNGTAELIAPNQPGAYRLFVDVRDSAGAVGYANVPFFVEGARDVGLGEVSE